MAYRKIEFTEAQVSYIREHFPTEAACDIAEYLHVSAPTVTKFARSIGLKKVDGWTSRIYTGRIVSKYRSGGHKYVNVA